MSNDLISRSTLMSHIESERRQWGEDYDAEQILGDIEDFPTAYDMDNVVEQLNDKFRVVRTDEDLEWNRAMDEAITIVKGGGVNGKKQS